MTDGLFQPPTTSTEHPSVGSTRPIDRRDLAIIGGAAAIFLVLAWHAWATRYRPDDVGWTFYPPPSVVALLLDRNRTDALIEIAGTGLVVASFTLVGLRLRSPRPRLRRVFRQPGFAGSLAASLGSGVAFARHSIDQAVLMFQASLAQPALGGDSFPVPRFTLFPSGASLAGLVAVLAAWLTLRWDGRWRRERSWLDQAGRLVGWGWLVALPIAELAIRVISIYD